jgi:hypothetical protein
MKCPHEVAEMLHTALVASGKTRARLSETTVAEAAGVTKLHPSWIVQWIGECSMLGIMVAPLARGGFGVMSTEALSGAPLIQL